METFPHKLSELRHQRGLSRERLAAQAGVSSGAIFRWERGQRGPTLEHALKVAEVLGVDLGTLVGGKEKVSA